MRYVRLAVAVLVLAGACQARAADKEIVQQAQRAFDAADRGKFIFGYLHLGGQYKDHTCVGVGDIVDKNDKPTGQFFLRYRFDWSLGDYDNKTLLDVDFDACGRFLAIDNEKSTSTVSPPYLFANGAMKVLGQGLLEALRKDLKKDDQKVIQDCIDKADAHAMLQFALDFQYNGLGR